MSGGGCEAIVTTIAATGDDVVALNLL